ncbi:hypothetical protein LAZ67_10002119 [Cordylochernes scorpioides]|uniref:Endonuclease/exonuclease/phosphatase domain-containing protein n=1 Tax=Cordylochernes scorpioides TaxID=51811 RepID=A0ABY6KWC2_9ARAC|nr:hypothetical protein LAZ67_10002119 [Cordylochernes scorpioides]
MQTSWIEKEELDNPISTGSCGLTSTILAEEFYVTHSTILAGMMNWESPGTNSPHWDRRCLIELLTGKMKLIINLLLNWIVIKEETHYRSTYANFNNEIVLCYANKSEMKVPSYTMKANLRCKVLILLLLSGIEQNPGPKSTRQTTLDVGKERDLHELITAMSNRIDDWGAKLESRFSGSLSKNVSKQFPAKNATIVLLHWNINGYHRIISLFSLIDYLKKFEVFAITETWLIEETKILTEDYHIIQLPAIKTEIKRRASGGIIVGSCWITIIINELIDGSDVKTCLLFTYLPPNASHEQNVTKLINQNEYQIKECNEVVIAGDIYIRTVNRGSLHNPLQLETTLNKHRHSKDKIISPLSERLIAFNDSNSIIANGRTKGDTEGSFTFVSDRGSSVSDYFMFTQSLIENISDMWIEELPYSDHLPIILVLNTDHKQKQSTQKSPWYDRDCYQMKNTTKSSLKKYTNSAEEQDREKYIEDRKKYLKLLKTKEINKIKTK